MVLVPSALEMLRALGAKGQVVGRTQYDTAPDLASLPSVGSMFDPSLEAVAALRPDLVVALAEGKGRGVSDHLDSLGLPVFRIDARDTTDVFRTVARLGTLLGRERAADSLAGALRAGLAEVRRSVEGRPTPSVLYLVWPDPPTTVGPRTFIAQVIGAAGGRIVFADVKQDWPQVSLEEIVRRQPDVVVLPVGGNHPRSVWPVLDAPGWRDLRAVRTGRVVKVPSDLMNRPGPRLVEAARTMRAALHPELGRSP